MLKTAAIFQNGMIFQRNKPVKIWGTGKPGEEVRASIQGKHADTVVRPDGIWLVKVPELEASEEEELTVQTKTESITLRQIAVGEVWVWRTAAKEELEYFSAVGYYFQKELEQCLDVPVGIVGCSWGGTTASAWTARQTLEKTGGLWIRDFEQRTAGMDMDAYWEKIHGNPLCYQGDIFSNPLNELVLPRTPGPEELGAFFQTDYAKEFQRQMEEVQGLLPVAFPGCLYENMVKTIAPFSTRGVLWHQGESDDLPEHQILYKDVLSGLIDDWRTLWQDQELPFLVVQLPGWERWMDMENQDYRTIRVCQENVANTVGHVGLCSIYDAGEQCDIHPKNKKIVGQRLALLARGRIYEEDILCEAPRMSRIIREKNRMTIFFENAAGGLKLDGSKVNALKIFRNREEVPFRAEVDGEKLLLTLEDDLSDTLDVEFAQEKWFQVNLYNQSDIPAIPFSMQCDG